MRYAFTTNPTAVIRFHRRPSRDPVVMMYVFVEMIVHPNHATAPIISSGVTLGQRFSLPSNRNGGMFPRLMHSRQLKFLRPWQPRLKCTRLYIDRPKVY